MAIPQEIARLPKATQALIKTQCRGDWTRVTIDRTGAITVHNTPQWTQPKKPSTKKAPAASPSKKPATKKPTVATPPPPPPEPPAPSPAVDVEPPPRVTPVKAVAPKAEARSITKPVRAVPLKSQQRPRKVLPEARPPQSQSSLKPQRADSPKPVPAKPAPVPEPPTVEPPAAAITEPPPVVTPKPVSPPAAAAPAAAPVAKVPPLTRTTIAPGPRTQPPVAPWDRSGFPRSPIKTRKVPTKPEHVPLPRPVAPREDVRLYASPLTSEDTEEVIDKLQRQEVQDGHGRKWIILPGIDTSDDWTGENLTGGALKVQQAVTKGLPDAAPLLFHDDVTALYGIDLDEVEAAVRFPQRVEIAPETGKKGYPVLKFFRGDVMVVVGFREPALPKIIAAYIGDLGLARMGSGAHGGGGGARKDSGLPKNPKALIKRLTGAGADCEEDPGGKTHSVTYRGQDLGKVTTGVAVTTKDIETAWQRMRRRMEAINVRENAPASR